MDLSIQELAIERLGGRGEGVAATSRGAVYVPYALPGEAVRAYVDGERGRLTEIITPSPDRIEAFCQYFTICGGCAVQTLSAAPYQAWKRNLVVTALRQAGVAAEVGELVDAHGAGRRRATFHVRVEANAAGRRRIDVGFMQARAHTIVDLQECPILAPSMDKALPGARLLAETLAHLDKPLDLLVTATLEGLDIDIRGAGAIDDQMRQKLLQLAEKLDLARLSNHGDIIIERRPPRLQMGRASLRLPPGAFLQATEAGEQTLADLVTKAVGRVKKVADLFCGVGTFALRLAETSEVLAIDSERHAIAALTRAAGEVQGLRKITAVVRDLTKRPVVASDLGNVDLSGCEAVVFDPPRAGAEPQARAIAATAIPKVVAVSCSAGTFARDAKILIEGGYRVDSITPVDQFRHAPHVEIVGVFSKPVIKATKRRGLLG